MGNGKVESGCGHLDGVRCTYSGSKQTIAEPGQVGGNSVWLEYGSVCPAVGNEQQQQACPGFTSCRGRQIQDGVRRNSINAEQILRCLVCEQTLVAAQNRPSDLKDLKKAALDYVRGTDKNELGVVVERLDEIADSRGADGRVGGYNRGKLG